ncbi:MAG: nucleotidyltransferase domain-containing protein [Halobacteriales archaeon]|nr:nucleotidyltransferase domain-containing protein [Halobacteriales archaeon]
MKRKTKNAQGSTSGVTVSLQIPAQDSNLYKHKATDDVLLFLSRNRFEEYTVSELASYTGHTAPSVGRSVEVLSENGLVIDRPDGNRRLVRINRERLSVPEDAYLGIPQTEFQEPVKVAVEGIRSRLDDVQAVVLYGSVARGEADRASDIDLWVLVSEDRPENQRTANEVRESLENRKFDGDRYGYDIDVESVSSVPKYTEEVREILLSGIPVYETENFETVKKLLMNEVEEDE